MTRLNVLEESLAHDMLKRARQAGAAKKRLALDSDSDDELFESVMARKAQKVAQESEESEDNSVISKRQQDESFEIVGHSTSKKDENANGTDDHNVQVENATDNSRPKYLLALLEQKQIRDKEHKAMQRARQQKEGLVVFESDAYLTGTSAVLVEPESVELKPIVEKHAAGKDMSTVKQAEQFASKILQEQLQSARERYFKRMNRL